MFSAAELTFATQTSARTLWLVHLEVLLRANRKSKAWWRGGLRRDFFWSHEVELCRAIGADFNRVREEAEQLRMFLNLSREGEPKEKLLSVLYHTPGPFYRSKGPWQYYDGGAEAWAQSALDARETALALHEAGTLDGVSTLTDAEVKAQVAAALEASEEGGRMELAHPLWCPDHRYVVKPSFEGWAFTQMMRAGFEYCFEEPDFTDGLIFAFENVTDRISAAVTSPGGPGRPSLRDLELSKMLEPNLLTSVEEAVEQTRGLGFDEIHHECKVVKAPTISHVVFVAGVVRDAMSINSIEGALGSTGVTQAMDGGVVIAYPHDMRDRMHPGGNMFDQFQAVQDLIEYRGATIRVVVNFDAAEFIMMRRSKSSTDSDPPDSPPETFQCWSRSTRQWFVAPLPAPNRPCPASRSRSPRSPSRAWPSPVQDPGVARYCRRGGDRYELDSGGHGQLHGRQSLLGA